MARILTSLSTAGRRILVLILASVAVLAFMTKAGVCAQGSNATGTTATAAAPKIAKKADTRLNWNSLTPAQQHALSPLAAEWNKMEFNRKEKWLAIGNKFATMTPPEQERMQERMRDWIKLTPAQRRAARESYTRAKKLNADKRSAQWQQYQRLSEEQKKKLSQAKLPKHVAALPATRKKAPPTIQLPQEALEQTLTPPAVASPAANPVVASPAAPVPAASSPAEVK